MHMPRPTPVGPRRAIRALVRNSMWQWATVVFWMTAATVNRILLKHVETGSLAADKSTEALRNTTTHQELGLFKIVREGRRKGRSGYDPEDPGYRDRKPLLTAKPPPIASDVGTEVAKTDCLPSNTSSLGMKQYSRYALLMNEWRSDANLMSLFGKLAKLNFKNPGS